MLYFYLFYSGLLQLPKELQVLLLAKLAQPNEAYRKEKPHFQMSKSVLFSKIYHIVKQLHNKWIYPAF